MIQVNLTNQRTRSFDSVCIKTDMPFLSIITIRTFFPIVQDVLKPLLYGKIPSLRVPKFDMVLFNSLFNLIYEVKNTYRISFVYSGSGSFVGSERKLLRIRVSRQRGLDYLTIHLLHIFYSSPLRHKNIWYIYYILPILI